MERLLRITLDESEYYFKVVKDLPVTTQTTVFHIRMDDAVTVILKTEKGWIQKDDSLAIKPDVVNAIGNALSLRFRLTRPALLD